MQWRRNPCAMNALENNLNEVVQLFDNNYFTDIAGKKKPKLYMINTTWPRRSDGK